MPNENHHDKKIESKRIMIAKKTMAEANKNKDKVHIHIQRKKQPKKEI